MQRPEGSFIGKRKKSGNSSVTQHGKLTFARGLANFCGLANAMNGGPDTQQRNPMKTPRRLPVFSFFVSSVFILHSSLFPQSSVTNLLRALDSLSLNSVNDWKMSPDLKSYKPFGDPTKSGFDDTQWQTVRLDENVYPDSCWLRKELVLPEKILGKPISGKLRFLTSIDDYGFLWVNGNYIGKIPWDAEFDILSTVQPKQKILIAIKAVNTGGPLRLMRAVLEVESVVGLKSIIENLSLSLRTGTKLLSFDTYQTNATKRSDPGIDKSLVKRGEKQSLAELLERVAATFDVSKISNLSEHEFSQYVQEFQHQLQPVADFAKKFTLYFDANAHIDAAWLWRDKETIEVCTNTFNSVENMMNARADFTYTQSAAAYYDWMERSSPETFKNMQKRVREGRWEITGGMWVEPDCNLPSGESWARHLLYSKRYFKEKFGTDVKVGWNPDSFGYNANMPMFYNEAGIDAFVTQKIGWNETNVFPHRVFWWKSADNSKILSYFPYDYVNEIKDPFQLVDWMRQFEANTGFRKMMILFGVGDHGGGPSLDMMARIDKLRDLFIYPRIEFGNTANYLSWLRLQDLAKIPVWNDELYLEYHQGTYTTQAKMKERNRTSEVLLTNAEKLSSLATFFGKPYRADDIESAWRLTLFNQFHDILPGSGIRENYVDANEKYDEVEAIGTHELTQSLATIAKSVNTSTVKKGMPIVIFNSLGWQRADIARFALPQADESDYAVFDANGKEIPSQTVRLGRFNREILFFVSSVPSIGYRVFELRKQSPSPRKNELRITESKLENKFFTLKFDGQTGWLASIIDKRNGKELLAGPGNELQLLEDKPRAWDAWNIGLTGTKYPSTFRKAEIVEKGPVRIVLRLTRDYLKPGTKKDFPTEDFPNSFFTQDLVLYNDLDRIDFVTNIDWWEEKTMLKVAFPLTVQDSVATYEIPYGTIERSTQSRNSWEAAKSEVPAQRWADVSTAEYGVSLLNRSKYGYDIKGNTMRLSLLRSPKWPDATADRGKHTIEYSLYPHEKGWQEASTVRVGYEYNVPLMTMATDAHTGSLPTELSFVDLQSPNLILTSIKKAEDSDAWVVQWYEWMGIDCWAELRLPKNVRKAVSSDFLERDGEPFEVRGNTVTVNTKKNSTRTIKVWFL